MRPLGPSRQHPKYDHPSGKPGIVVAVGVWLEVVVVDEVVEVLEPKVEVEEVVSTELDVDNFEDVVDVVLDGVDAEVLLLEVEDLVVDEVVVADDVEVVLDVLDVVEAALLEVERDLAVDEVVVVELEAVLDVLDVLSDEVVDELVEEDLAVVVGVGWRGSAGGGGGFHWPLKSYTLSRSGPPQISVSLPEQRIVQPLAPALLSYSMLSPQTGHQKVSKRIPSLNKKVMIQEEDMEQY